VAYVAHIGEIRKMYKILAENLMGRDLMEYKKKQTVR
jgi:hypothetical protein